MCIYIYIYIYIATYPPRRPRGAFGWHYLSNATCLMWPHMFCACFVVSRITAIFEEKTCVRQVVLYKWFPLKPLGQVDVRVHRAAHGARRAGHAHPEHPHRLRLQAALRAERLDEELLVLARAHGARPVVPVRQLAPQRLLHLGASLAPRRGGPVRPVGLGRQLRLGGDDAGLRRPAPLRGAVPGVVAVWAHAPRAAGGEGGEREPPAAALAEGLHPPVLDGAVAAVRPLRTAAGPAALREARKGAPSAVAAAGNAAGGMLHSQRRRGVGRGGLGRLHDHGLRGRDPSRPRLLRGSAAHSSLAALALQKLGSSSCSLVEPLLESGQCARAGCWHPIRSTASSWAPELDPRHRVAAVIHSIEHNPSRVQVDNPSIRQCNHT